MNFHNVVALATAAIFSFTQTVPAQSNFWVTRAWNVKSTVTKSLALETPRLNAHPNLKEILKETAPFSNVQSTHESSTQGPLVFIVQDVHMNVEAQRNIGKTLSVLAKRVPEIIFGVEAARGSFDFTPFRQAPDPSVTKDIADYMLSQKMISGVSWFGLIRPQPTVGIIGVDDPVLYQENVEAYKKAAPYLGEMSQHVQGEIDRHDAQKGALSPISRALYETLKSYRSGRLPIGDTVKFIARHVPLEHYPDLRALAHAVELEAGLDFSKVESEREAVLTKVPVEKLSALALAQRAGEIEPILFYRELKKLADLKPFPHFETYVNYMLLADSIDQDGVFEQMEQLAQAAIKKIANNKEQEFFARAHELQLLQKLVNFELTPEEWGEYLSLRARPQAAAKQSALTRVGNRKLYSEQQIASVAPSGLPRNDSLDAFESFYRLAEERNQKIVENLDSRLRGNDAKAVLIVGGFHTPGITELLKKKGCSVVVLSPKFILTDAPEESYLSAFLRNRTPISQLFLGEKLTVASAAQLLGAKHVARNAVATFSILLAVLGASKKWSLDTLKKVVHVASLQRFRVKSVQGSTVELENAQGSFFAGPTVAGVQRLQDVPNVGNVGVAKKLRPTLYRLAASIFIALTYAALLGAKDGNLPAQIVAGVFIGAVAAAVTSISASKTEADAKPLVVIVGAGPAGFEVAKGLVATHRILFIELDPHIRWGRLTKGIQWWKGFKRPLVETYEKIITNPNVLIWQGVEVGEDIEAARLIESASFIVDASGAQIDRELGIPGERLHGVYQGIPFFRDVNKAHLKSDYGLGFIPSKEQYALETPILLLGGGNVIADLVKMLRNMDIDPVVAYRGLGDVMHNMDQDYKDEFAPKPLNLLQLTEAREFIGDDQDNVIAVKLETMKVVGLKKKDGHLVPLEVNKKPYQLPEGTTMIDILSRLDNWEEIRAGINDVERQQLQSSRIAYEVRTESTGKPSDTFTLPAQTVFIAIGQMRKPINGLEPDGKKVFVAGQRATRTGALNATRISAKEVVAKIKDLSEQAPRLSSQDTYAFIRSLVEHKQRLIIDALLQIDAPDQFVPYFQHSGLDRLLNTVGLNGQFRRSLADARAHHEGNLTFSDGAKNLLEYLEKKEKRQRKSSPRDGSTTVIVVSAMAMMSIGAASFVAFIQNPAEFISFLNQVWAMGLAPVVATATIVTARVGRRTIWSMGLKNWRLIGPRREKTHLPGATSMVYHSLVDLRQADALSQGNAVLQERLKERLELIAGQLARAARGELATVVISDDGESESISRSELFTLMAKYGVVVPSRQPRILLQKISNPYTALNQLQNVGVPVKSVHAYPLRFGAASYWDFTVNVQLLSDTQLTAFFIDILDWMSGALSHERHSIEELLQASQQSADDA